MSHVCSCVSQAAATDSRTAGPATSGWAGEHPDIENHRHDVKRVMTTGQNALVTTDARLTSHFTTLDVSAIEDVALSQCRRAGARTQQCACIRSAPACTLRDLELETAVDHRDLGSGYGSSSGAPQFRVDQSAGHRRGSGMRPDEHVSWPKAMLTSWRSGGQPRTHEPSATVFTSRLRNGSLHCVPMDEMAGLLRHSANCSRRASTIPVPLWSAPWRPPISPIWPGPGSGNNARDPAGVYRGCGSPTTVSTTCPVPPHRSARAGSILSSRGS